MKVQMAGEERKRDKQRETERQNSRHIRKAHRSEET